MGHTPAKTAVLSTKVPERLRSKLERIAGRRKVPVSVVVREALERLAASEDAEGSFTERAGALVGSLSGPPDLSSNPKHMKGYGE